MEILYKAKDGTIFSNEYECEDYENSLECAELKHSLFWWNSDREPIPVCVNAEPLHYFYIESYDALEFMLKVFRDYGWNYEELVVGSMYHWDDAEESFCNIANQINYYNNKLNELREIRYFMEKGVVE